MQRVTNLAGIGSHRFMTRVDLTKKSSKRLMGAVAVYNYHPYENLGYLGRSSRGTPVYIQQSLSGERPADWSGD